MSEREHGVNGLLATEAPDRRARRFGRRTDRERSSSFLALVAADDGRDSGDMLRSLKITGFRAFSSFEMKDLTRVNLLVGENNSGKTCVLEAVEILCGAGDGWVLTRSPARRGERSENGAGSSADGSGHAEAVNLLHLFFGHPRSGNPSFRIEATSGEETATTRFVEATVKDLQPILLGTEGAQFVTVMRRPLAVRSNNDRVGELHLTPDGAHTPVDTPVGSGLPCQFVANDRRQRSLRRQWDEIVATPDEVMVRELMRTVDERVEQFAALASMTGPDFVVTLRGTAGRVPIGSLGDGVKSLLVIGTNLVRSARGVLLVDDIDAGLHYSVMTKMWKLVIEAARRLDVQVFATSHCLDCLRALAWACEEKPELGPEVSVHSLGRGKPTSVHHSAGEVRAAIEHEIELR